MAQSFPFWTTFALLQKRYLPRYQVCTLNFRETFVIFERNQLQKYNIFMKYANFREEKFLYSNFVI
jgi:hypothetical protein